MFQRWFDLCSALELKRSPPWDLPDVVSTFSPPQHDRTSSESINYSWPQSHLGNLPWGSSNVKTYCIHARRLIEDDTGWPLVAVCLHHAPTVSYVGLVVWFLFWAPQALEPRGIQISPTLSHHRQSIGHRLAGEHHHSFRRSEDPGVPDRCWHRGAGGPAPCWRQTWDGWSTDFSRTIPKIRLIDVDFQFGNGDTWSSFVDYFWFNGKFRTLNWNGATVDHPPTYCRHTPYIGLIYGRYL